MQSYEIPNFGLGETVKGTADDGTTLINDAWLGQIHEFQYGSNVAISRGGKKRKTGRTVRAICIRNTSGAAMLPSRVITLDPTAGYHLLQRTLGMSTVLCAPHVAVVDDALPTAGVAQNDIFWAVIEGPQLVYTPLAGSQFNGVDIAVGAPLVAATGSTTGATTSGRITNVTFTFATAGDTSNGFDGFRMARNLLGAALSARTTAETNALCLVNCQCRY